ncbi:hypothetical protein WDU94_011580, partial [Cyamophila willieti]
KYVNFLFTSDGRRHDLCESRITLHSKLTSLSLYIQANVTINMCVCLGGLCGCVCVCVCVGEGLRA